jgi:hypothetical protein
MKDNLNNLKQRASELSVKAQVASEAARRERASAVMKLGAMNEQLKDSKVGTSDGELDHELAACSTMPLRVALKMPNNTP